MVDNASILEWCDKGADATKLEDARASVANETVPKIDRLGLAKALIECQMTAEVTEILTPDQTIVSPPQFGTRPTLSLSKGYSIPLCCCLSEQS